MLAAVSIALVAIQAGVHEALEKCVLFLENGRISSSKSLVVLCNRPGGYTNTPP